MDRPPFASEPAHAPRRRLRGLRTAALALAVGLVACRAEPPAGPAAPASAGSSASPSTQASGAPAVSAPAPVSATVSGLAVPVYTIPAGASAAESGAAAPSAATDAHALPGTNLAIRMPGAVTVESMNFAGPAYLVKGEAGCEVMVRPVDPGLPRTLDEVRESIQSDTIRWRQFNRIEGSPQGWIVEYETDGLVDKTKKGYGVNVRTRVEGHAVACSRVLATEAAARCALAACLSLHARP
jgi:hypothetical protein